MRFVRLGSAVLASTMAVTAFAGAAGAASSENGSRGVPKLESTATAAEACEVIFGTDAFDKAPSEGEVAPGEAVSVDVTWGSGFEKGSTVEVVGCTAVDGDFSEALSTRIRKVKNDGLFVHEFTVPKNADKGAVLCQRAIVIGESTTGSPKAERLDADCFTVAAAAGNSSEERSAPAEPVAGDREEAAGAKNEPATAAPKTAASGSPAGETQGAPAADDKKAAGATVAGETETRPEAAAAPSALARTGSADRPLAAAAGLLFILGGLAVAFSRPLRGVLR